MRNTVTRSVYNDKLVEIFLLLLFFYTFPSLYRLLLLFRGGVDYSRCFVLVYVYINNIEDDVHILLILYYYKYIYYIIVIIILRYGTNMAVYTRKG